jgi:hypothetical protein
LRREATQHTIKSILAIVRRDDDGDEFGHDPSFSGNSLFLISICGAG